MLPQRAIESLRDYITSRDGFTVIAHISPDGDTLGSTLALLGLLRQLGKRAEAVCTDRVPALYGFLPLADQLRTPEQAVGYPHVISVDCADLGRLGQAQALFARAASTYNIDHHPTNDAYAGANAVDPTAAATGELIYRLALSLGLPITAELAACLYTALMTDTGNFSYSNTTGDTLRIAGALLDAGADGYDLNLRIYRNTPFCKLRLLGVAIGGIRLYEQDRIGMVSLTRAQVEACGAREEDTEGVIDHVRDIDSVEVAVFFKESGPETWKVSLRAKRWADVGAMAARLGGGGHPRAAGYTAKGGLEAVWAQALAAAKEALG